MTTANRLKSPEVMYKELEAIAGQYEGAPDSILRDVVHGQVLVANLAIYKALYVIAHQLEKQNAGD